MVDHAVDDISCMLDVPRHCLHVVSIRPSKSKIYGDVTQDGFPATIFNGYKLAQKG